MVDWSDVEYEEEDFCHTDLCHADCHSREERICDEETGERHLLHLMRQWGYESLLPEHRLDPPPFNRYLHIVIGVIIFIAGIAGTVSNMSLLAVHVKLKERLLDPTGLMICNFLFANLAMAIFQFPFSGLSAIAGIWLWGDIGCQLYAFVGFFFGIGVVFSLGLIILDSYILTFKLAAVPRPSYYSWIIIAISWHLILLFTVPPLMDIFGRYGPEPSGTSCTIDYWHGNFRNYNNFVFFLVIFAYIIPVSSMLFMFLRTVHQIQKPETTKRWSLLFTEHQAAVTKVCGILLIVQIVCWTPYAVLVLWTVIFSPSTLNIYYTTIPSIACKMAPFLNAMLVWWNVPRVTAGFFFIKDKKNKDDFPEELFDYKVEMDKEEPGTDDETESLTPGSG